MEEVEEIIPADLDTELDQALEDDRQAAGDYEEVPLSELPPSSEHIELLNIPVLDIEFGERARKSYQNLAALADSFQKRGIISPLAVKRQPEKEKPFYLLAGGRRYSAALLAGFSSVPCRVYPASLSSLDVREIELMENVQRENLSWQEEVTLTNEIHLLQVARYGKAVGPSEGHSAADTAKLLAVSPMTVSRDRQLAMALEEHGAVLSQAKNKSGALRVLRHIERQEEDTKLAKKFEADVSGERDASLKRRLVNGYNTGDFFSGAMSVPDLSVHCVEIDPPYAIDLMGSKYSPLMLEENYTEVDENIYEDFLRRTFSECHRAMFPLSWILCWCSFEWFNTVQRLLTEAKFSVCNTPGVWYKLGINGQSHHPDIHIAPVTELFVAARKGDARLRKAGRNNVFAFPVVHQDDKIHPTERPVELMHEILQTFTPPGSTVMVPFLGSGNTLLAASNLSCASYGWELKGDTYKNTFIARASAGQLGAYKSYREAAK